MIEAILIDDEQFVKDDIRNILFKHFNNTIKIVSEASGVEEGVKKINTYKPQIVFLDIHMQDGTGFDLLNKIKNKTFQLIFVTGFDDKALRALKVGALDYIIKPVLEEELVEAVNKALKMQYKQQQLETLIEVSQNRFNNKEEKRIILKNQDNIYSVNENDILYCKSDGNYTTYYTIKNEKILISKPIKIAEELLSETTFIRCHQSYLVNKNKVIKYNKNGYLLLENDLKIPVSSRRKDYTLGEIF